MDRLRECFQMDPIKVEALDFYLIYFIFAMDHAQALGHKTLFVDLVEVVHDVARLLVFALKRINLLDLVGILKFAHGIDQSSFVLKYFHCIGSPIRYQELYTDIVNCRSVRK